jgi:hypothetical protein
MAPPEAMAKKHQLLRRYGAFGICVDTRSRVHDVPLTDCFFLDDRLLVESTENGGIILTLRFEVRFIKSTMFRRIIERTTKDEFLKGANRLRQVLAQSIPDEVSSSEEIIIVSPPTLSSKLLHSPRSTNPKDFGFVCITTFLCLFFFNVFLFFELKSLERSINKIQEQISPLIESEMCLKANI